MTREPENPSYSQVAQCSQCVTVYSDSHLLIVHVKVSTTSHEILYVQEPSTTPLHPSHPLNLPLPCHQHNPNLDNTRSTSITSLNNPNNNLTKLTCLKAMLKY